MPPPGTRPVELTAFSPRSKDYLMNYMELMVAEDRERLINESDVKPYMDAHFQDRKNLTALACRMGKAGMIRAVPEKRGEVAMFTV